MQLTGYRLEQHLTTLMAQVRLIDYMMVRGAMWSIISDFHHHLGLSLSVIFYLQGM